MGQRGRVRITGEIPAEGVIDGGPIDLSVREIAGPLSGRRLIMEPSSDLIGTAPIASPQMSLVVEIDDREPTGVIESVRARPDVDRIRVCRLDVGDVVIGDVGIERKTLRDYVRSLIGRGRPDLYDQVRRLCDRYPHRYLLLEDEFPADADQTVPSSAVRGSAASITARYRTPVIPCSDRDRLIDMAVRLGRKHTEEPARRSLPYGSVTELEAPVAKRMYGCIDGIGPDIADHLYRAFPTVIEVATATREELQTVEGIGPKRADAIHRAFRR